MQAMRRDIFAEGGNALLPAALPGGCGNVRDNIDRIWMSGEGDRGSLQNRRTDGDGLAETSR